MNHRTASSLLSALPDALLPAPVEAEVRSHMEDCARCTRNYRELELSEILVRGLPQRFVPEDWGPEADRRLVALASWAGGPVPQPASHSPYQALGSFAAAGVLALLLCTASIVPHLASADASMAFARIAVPELPLLPPAIR